MSPLQPAQVAEAPREVQHGGADRPQALPSPDRAAELFDEQMARLGKRIGDAIATAVYGARG